MKLIYKSDPDIEYVRMLIEEDIIHSAVDASFFCKMKIEPVDYIEQTIALAKMFELDFWDIISRNCSDIEIEKFHSLYEEKPRRTLTLHSSNKTKKDEVYSDY